VPGVTGQSPPPVNGIDAAPKGVSIIAITNARTARA
jgi:hypothetical protein